VFRTSGVPVAVAVAGEEAAAEEEETVSGDEEAVIEGKEGNIKLNDQACTSATPIH